MQFNKILWPTDFSGSAEKALPTVRSLTDKYGTEIHVLYVIEDIAHHKPWYGDFEKERIDKILKWEEKTAEERLDKICKDYLEGCPLYIKHIAVGDPAQEILKLAEKENVDAIVMSTRGAKGHFRFGSVAEKVVKNAPVAVITVPMEEAAAETS
jgi:nucleotide-binding universal stress UspA family protein